MSGPEPRFRTARRATAVVLRTVTAVLTALVLLGVVRVVLWFIDGFWTGLVGS